MALDKEFVSYMKDGFLLLRAKGLDPEDYGLSSERQDLEFWLWELKFLDIFLDLQTFTLAGDYGILDFTRKIHIFFSLMKTGEGADELHTDIQDNPPGCIALWKIKLEFRPKYSFPKIPLSANYKVDDDDIDIPTPDFVMKFIDVVQENLNFILLSNEPRSMLFVPEPKDQIKEVLKELKLLRLFVLFLSKKCIELQTRHIFFTHALIVARHAAMVAWLYLPIHGRLSQGLDPSEMNVVLADQLQMKNKHIQPTIPKIYIDVLQTLKSNLQSLNCLLIF